MPNDNYNKYLLTYFLAGNYQKTILNSTMEMESTYQEFPSLVRGIAFQFNAFESIFNRDSNPHFTMLNK
jgi:lipoprotein NlpI